MTYVYNRTPATVLGLAIGDALGQPFEFSTSDQIIKSGWKGDLIGSTYGFEGMWNLDPGQYTDDTMMALCISNSLLDKDEFDLDDVAKKYIGWVESRDLRGIGIRTERSIHNLIRGISPKESGQKHVGRPKPSFKRISKSVEELPTDSLHGPGNFCGCGTVMRCAPIGLFYYKAEEEMIRAAAEDATITHDHADARDSSIFLCRLIADILFCNDPFERVEAMCGEYSGWFEYDHVTRLCKEALDMARDKSTTFADAIALGTSGTAHETLASAVYCFLRYDNFKDAVASAVLIGGDTDSRAAIVGALAGTRYGLEGIPKDWVKQVEGSSMLKKIDADLYSKAPFPYYYEAE